MASNPVRQIVGAADRTELTALLSPLVGRLCLSARLGYANELQLECGEPGARESADGLWSIAMRATPWELRRPLEIVASTDEEPDEALRERIRTIEGLRIEACTVRFPDLQLALSFAGGLRLAVGPEGDIGDLPSSEDVLAYWVVYTPDGMVLTTGPGPFWTYKSKDDPFT